MKNSTREMLSGMAAFAFLLSLGPTAAQDPPFPTDVDFVVTFQQDLFGQSPHGRSLPMIDESGIEAACVALSLGQSLLAGGQAVTLFPALAGVKLANESLLAATGAGEALCVNPFYDPKDDPQPMVSLLTHVKRFIALGGNVLVCPLCRNSRGYTPDNLVALESQDYCPIPSCGAAGQVALGNRFTIAPTFISADKAVDF